MRGTLPSQEIQALVASGAVRSAAGIAPEQIQPSSLDLSLSVEAYSMTGSLLPLGTEKVRDLIERFARYPINLREPAVLVRDNVYLVRLRENFALPADVAAYANNKSSTGRIDLQTRVICDGNPRYDKIPEGYHGELWLEVIPKSFDVRLRTGDCLNQVILYRGREILDAPQMLKLFGEPDGRKKSRPRILHDSAGGALGIESVADDGALLMTLDLNQEIVGYVAKKSLKPKPIDLAAVGSHEPDDYFEPIKRPRDGALFLRQNAFYIFSTFEYISVPPDYAVEMLPYDTSAGEFRAHYAGFFDPGFGYGKEGEVKGTPAVLEVRPYEDDLIVRHRQPVCKMAYERLSARPDKLYGVGMKSNYAHQRGPRLSKFFRQG
ncbi:MAG: 2'-deoxycytidine 5'-triphosphate deaminase [Planctomycetes bacterium]|jgi:dCTP deaminase|nr:2'-deoxycytidine 5'-triphosphate deaminase [Planctomycetota bacterium]MCL4730563.1 2'-deoxycytidine 5'-triphosphate deaminase [Planctomycetota bacterium]